jgi:hypothetical protein
MSIGRKTAAQLDAEIAEVLVGGSSVGFNVYRHLPPDEARGNPLHAWGQLHADKLGSYWTIEVDVPLTGLASLRPVRQTAARLKSITTARKAGKPLPPLELGIYRDGSAWIVDGNHRLIDARQAGLTSIPATFTFVGT